MNVMIDLETFNRVQEENNHEIRIEQVKAKLDYFVKQLKQDSQEQALTTQA